MTISTITYHSWSISVKLCMFCWKARFLNYPLGSNKINFLIFYPYHLVSLVSWLDNLVVFSFLFHLCIFLSKFWLNCVSGFSLVFNIYPKTSTNKVLVTIFRLIIWIHFYSKEYASQNSKWKTWWWIYCFFFFWYC